MTEEQGGCAVIAASSSDEGSERSRRDGFVVRLTNYDLGSIPVGLTSQFGATLVRLELVDCSIRRLERFKLDRMPHLRVVNLSHNHISYLGDAFASNTQLQVLYLDENPLFLSVYDLPSLANTVVALSLKNTLAFNLWTTTNVLCQMKALRLVTFGVGSLLPSPYRSSFEAVSSSTRSELTEFLNDSILSAPPSHSTTSLRPSRIVESAHYRPFLLAHLPRLWAVDGFLVNDAQLASAAALLHRHFTNQSTSARTRDGNLHRLLKARETGAQLDTSSSSALNTLLQRSLLPGPQWFVPLAKRRLPFRIRQFEYHPTIDNELLFGTTDAQVGFDSFDRREEHFPLGWAAVGAASENEDAPNTILGLHWLRKNPNLFLAGCDSGTIQMFDKRLLSRSTSIRDTPLNGMIRCYQPFTKLTCVQGSCDDTMFLASGESPNVCLYDVETMAIVRSFVGIHSQQINVLRFANHSPNLFATSSFDKTVKLWDLRCPTEASAPVFTGECKRRVLTVCFSPDDKYVLSGGENNEVLQWDIASGGKTNVVFDIPQKDLPENWSRAYYLSSGRHVIVGSCREDSIHVVCVQTGKLLRDVELSPVRSLPELYCLSLRGDPHHPLRFSAIIAIPKPPYYPLQLVSYDLSQPFEAHLSP